MVHLTRHLCEYGQTRWRSRLCFFNDFFKWFTSVSIFFNSFCSLLHFGMVVFTMLLFSVIRNKIIMNFSFSKITQILSCDIYTVYEFLKTIREVFFCNVLSTIFTRLT